MGYKDAEYWEAIQRQEMEEEERRCEDKHRIWEMLNAQPAEPQKPQKRIWTEAEIKNLIQTNDEVLYLALKKLYNCQTADEKAIGATRVYNGAGFNAYDAQFLTSVAEFLLRTGFLTAKQKEITRRKLVKYNKQLTKLANA